MGCEWGCNPSRFPFALSRFALKPPQRRSMGLEQGPTCYAGRLHCGPECNSHGFPRLAGLRIGRSSIMIAAVGVNIDPPPPGQVSQRHNPS